MVKRGLAPSREAAQSLILAGAVTLPGLEGRGRPTAGRLIDEAQPIAVRASPRYVSRGGDKLEHALKVFGTDVSGVVALDIGASTGGFTDCLLQAGASRVYAVDVGHGQLQGRIRADPRVVSIERTNARYPFELPERVGLMTVDVSFISFRLVLESSLAHLKPGGSAVVLLKPQFEAGPDQVGPRGVVRDPLVHAAVIGRAVKWAVDRGLRVRGLAASPLLGDEGNREFLMLLDQDA
jgi:23S rRNA (cytidine1920-2'-O)/16S rRNA (cytidine1409-2'-O)-methyltransferase